MANSGIYLIEDTVSRRRYVGSAINLPNRQRQHFQSLARGDHHSRFMQRTYQKRPEALKFSVLLYCSPENLLMYEQAVIDGFKPEFNTSPTAGSQLGFKHPPESRAKMSEAAKRTKNFTGHRHTEEARKRISENRKGKGGDKGWTQERRDKIGAAHKGRVIPQEMRNRISRKLTGTSTGRGKLTEDQVRDIRKLRADTGWGKFKIGRALGINHRQVSTVLGGHGYGWVE